jgi:hypothetical protein
MCDDVCSEVITESMIHNDLNLRVIEGYQRFALLWRLTGTICRSIDLTSLFRRTWN